MAVFFFFAKRNDREGCVNQVYQEPPRIESLHVENYRALKNLTFSELTPLTVACEAISNRLRAVRISALPCLSTVTVMIAFSSRPVWRSWPVMRDW